MPDVNPPSGGGGDFLDSLTEKKLAGVPYIIWFVVGVLALALYLRSRNKSSSSNSGSVVPANAFELPYLGGYPIGVSSGTPHGGGAGGGGGRGDKDKDKDKKGGGGQGSGGSNTVGPGPDPFSATNSSPNTYASFAPQSFNTITGTTSGGAALGGNAQAQVYNPVPPLRVTSVAGAAPTQAGAQISPSTFAPGYTGPVKSTGIGGPVAVTAFAPGYTGPLKTVTPGPTSQPHYYPPGTAAPKPTYTAGASIARAISVSAAAVAQAFSPKPAVTSRPGVSVNNMMRLGA